MSRKLSERKQVGKGKKRTENIMSLLRILSTAKGKVGNVAGEPGRGQARNSPVDILNIQGFPGDSFSSSDWP